MVLKFEPLELISIFIQLKNLFPLRRTFLRGKRKKRYEKKVEGAEKGTFDEFFGALFTYFQGIFQYLGKKVGSYS